MTFFLFSELVGTIFETVFRALSLSHFGAEMEPFREPFSSQGPPGYPLGPPLGPPRCPLGAPLGHPRAPRGPPAPPKGSKRSKIDHFGSPNDNFVSYFGHFWNTFWILCTSVSGCRGMSWDVAACRGMSRDVVGCRGMSWIVVGCLGMSWDDGKRTGTQT